MAVGYMSVTVTVQLSLIPVRAVDVAVMTALPPPTAVTTPLETVATEGSPVVQVSSLSVVLAGLKVTIRVCCWPLFKPRVEGRLIPVRGTEGVTVTVQLAFILPRAVDVDVAVIVALPPPTAVTTPFVTVATAGSLVDHERPFSVVLAGV
jgi:hypothetical protein